LILESNSSNQCLQGQVPVEQVPVEQVPVEQGWAWFIVYVVGVLIVVVQALVEVGRGVGQEGTLGMVELHPQGGGGGGGRQPEVQL
jgi:hypothetical protein